MVRDFIVKGVRQGDAPPYFPYRLNPAMEEKPSQFEFRIVVDNVAYTYGFVISKECVLEEWLYAHFTYKESCIFHREGSNCRVGLRFRKDLNPYAILSIGTNSLLLTRMGETCDPLHPVYS